MDLKNIITESFKTVSINGILYSLNNDEKALYDKIKSEEKVLKSDLDEFTQRLASLLVSRGLLRRRKDKQHNIYFTTRGRRKIIGKRTLDEVAPPDREIEKWIGQNKDKFKEKYGKNYKTFLYGRAWNKFNGKSITESVNPLFEGVEDLQKYYPNIPLERLRELIALDPTYKGGDQLGKYGKWIINLVNNNLKNEANLRKYEELKKQYPDGINPKNGKPFQAPALLPSIKDEDLYKITNSLNQYNINQKEIGKPITDFKTLPELDKVLASIKSQGIPTNKLAAKRYNLIKKAEKVGFRTIYDGQDWIVGIPTTPESSYLFGEDTSWCTTSKSGGMYEYYTKRGPLYINLNKENGKLYQFHFESDSFMDEHDEPITVVLLSKSFSPQLKQIYDNAIKEIQVEATKLKYSHMFNNKPYTKEEEEEIIKEIERRPFEVLQYINNPTERMVNVAISANPKNIIYVENPTDEQILECAENDPACRYIPMMLDRISDDMMLELIERENTYFSRFIQKDESRFTDAIFNKALTLLNLNQEDFTTCKLSEEHLTKLLRAYFNEKDMTGNEFYALRAFFNKTISDDDNLDAFDKVNDYLRQIGLVLNARYLNVTKHISVKDIETIIKEYNVYLNVKYDVSNVNFDELTSIDEKAIDKLLDLYDMITNSNDLFNITKIINHMNVAQCIRLFRINPGLFNQIISRKGDNKYDLTAITMSIFVDMNKDEIIQFSNEIIKNRYNREALATHILPILNEFDEDIQMNILESIVLSCRKIIHKSEHNKNNVGLGNRDIRYLLSNVQRNCPDLPLYIQKLMLDTDIQFVRFIEHLDEKIQKKLIKKNPFNIKFINNPSQEVIDMAYEMNPETRDYLR